MFETEVDLINCDFLYNFAVIGGGAVSAGLVKVNVTQALFNSNEASSGAGLDILMGFAVTNSLFVFNKAKEDGGGAIRVSGDMLELSNCTFENNSATRGGTGGAININSLISLIVNYTKYIGNFAKDGGAIHMKNAKTAIMWNSSFIENKADSIGGAIVAIKSDSKVYLFAYSNFLNNSAGHGGAVAFNVMAEVPELTSVCNDNIDWLDNNIEKISFYFQNNLLHELEDYDGLGQYNLTLITNCLFSNNKVSSQKGRGGAIVAQCLHFQVNIPDSKIKKSSIDRIILQNSTFISNSAAIGGGLYYNTCRIFIRNTNFQQNSAQKYGGGISSESSWMCLLGNMHFISNDINSESGWGTAIYSNNGNRNCEVNLCPLVWTNHTKFNFNEKSEASRPVLYGGMLDRCESLPGQSLKAELERLTLSNYNWISKAIASPAINFCFKGNCTVRTRKKVVYPGQSFNVSVGCLDQFKQPLNYCLVQSDYDAHYQLGSGENKRFVNGYDNLTFTLTSKSKGVTSLSIVSNNIRCIGDMWKKLEIIVSVRSCPLGFQLQNKKCDCDNRLLNTTLKIECSINNEVIILTNDGWLSFKQNLLRVRYDCPLDYCLKKQKYISPLQPDVQCAHKRGGVLCGECLADHSVVLGSWKCKMCSHLSSYNFIWLTVVMVLAGVVLVVFLLLVKMTVSGGTINGLIFYANIVSSSGLLDHQNCVIHPFFHVFISWINLDLGIEVCFYSGMDVYQKTWLQFVFPFYIWFLVGVIILVCHYSSTVMKLMGMRNIEVLATLFLLSYAKLLKTIVTALSVTNIMVASADNISDPLRPHKVWVYDGNIDYFGSKHLPLFIVAVLFLFTLFMPYTLFLLCGQWLQYIPRKRGFRWIHSIAISTIMDAYHAPYTKHYRYWTGLGLLVRCSLFTIFVNTYSTRINLMFITVAVLLLHVIRIASSGKLYRNKVVGLLELFYLSNLGILATVLLVNESLCDAITASISISFIVFAGTLLFHVHQETKRNSFYKVVKDNICKIFVIKNVKSDTINKEAPKQETTTNYYELRESLIDSTM